MARFIRNRSAFTLIELLVVFAVVAVLAALIVPAVQRARETARRVQCITNVKQIALAMQAYHDVHRVFPLNYGNGVYDVFDRGASWMQMILPMVGQDNLYKQIQWGAPLAAPANTAVARTPIAVYLCPSDPTSGLMDFRANVPGVWAVNNY